MRMVRLFVLISTASVFALSQISGSFSAAGQETRSEKKPGGKTPAIKSAPDGFPLIGLKDGFEYPATPGGRETADAAKSASADFDSDGVADLIIADQSGTLRFLKGNSQFLTNPESDPFIETDLSAVLGIVPDFFEQGDFNADGQKDILAARRGEKKLILLAGLGTGQFAPSVNIELDGAITALATGEIGRADGQTDIAVGETGKKGAQLRVFEHPAGAFKHKPEIIALPSAAQFIATGFLGADGYSDIAVACGSKIVFVQGRGQVTPWDILRPKEIQRPKAVVSTKTLSGNITGLAIGQFTKDRSLSLAVLTSDGTVQTLAPARVEKSTNFAGAALPNVARKPVAFVPADVDAANFAGIQDISSSANTDQTPAIDRIDPNLSAAERRAAREKIMRQDAAEFAKLTPDEQSAMIANAKQEAFANTEKSRENFIKTVAAVPVEFAAWETKSIIRDARLATGSAAGLTKARVGFSGKDDLVVIDPASNRVNVIAEAANADGLTATQVFSFESETTPVAVLPVRINLDAKSDLIVLRKGSAQPAILLSAATLDLTVDTNLDGPSSCENAGPCTLRGAIIRANNNPGTRIGFDISSTPTIALLDELPIVRANGTIIVGLAVNVPGVVLDGTNAGAADGIKIRTSDAVVAGLTINSFKGIDNGNGSLVGGNALTIESTQLSPNNGNNWIFANYLGTDLNGTTDKGNNVGLNIFDAHDNLIGYSDPTYRQLISGNGDPENGEPGVGIITTNSVRALFHNNTIGLNITGAVAMPNPIGLLLTGSQNSIGGDGVGEGNTISGNLSPIGNGFAVCRGEGVLIDPLTTLDENGNPTGEILTFDNRIKGSRIGTDVTGTIAVGNCREGILAPPYTATVIGSLTERGRNTVSGNGWGGINCLDISGLIPTLTTNFGFCQIVGNNVGTDITGTVGIPNLTANGNAGFGIIVNNGINVFHNRNLGVVGFPLGFTFGDSCTGGCNLVNGTIFRSGKFGDVGIYSNYMGVNKSGTASLSNYPTSYASYSGVIAGRGNTAVGDWAIAGTQPVSFGNLMSGSFCGGLLLANAITTSFATLSAKANLVGTDATGTFAVPNNIAGDQSCGGAGVYLSDGFFADIRFGGLRDEEKNIVAGNNSDGVGIENNGGEMQIINTYIGVNKFQQPLGNTGNGISFSGDAFSHTIIGGTGPNERNIIRSNGKAGIAAIAIGSLTNAIPRGLELIGNSIANNGELGFDLMRAVGSFPYPNDGVNENDCQDADRGANSLQNYPNLIAPIFNGNGTVTVSGVLRSAPLENFRLDFYSNSTADGTNYGEGEFYIGSLNVSTDGNGFSSFAATSTGIVPSSHTVVATATNSDGETSEFSCAAGVCTPAASVAELRDQFVEFCAEADVVNIDTDEADANLSDGVCDVDVSDSEPQCSLRAAIQQGNASNVNPIVVYFAIPGAGVHTIQPTSALPEITKPFLILGETQPGATNSPLIEIRGDLAGDNVSGLRFSGGASGSRISGLAINRFFASGILFNGVSGKIAGNYLGLNADGISFDENRIQGAGVTLINSVGSGIGTITGNVIAGNSGGILITGGSGNEVVNNKIGTDKDGNFLIIDGQPWISGDIGVGIVNSAGNLVGEAQKRNIISANGVGINIVGAQSAGNLVKSNYIGTNLNGTAAVNNGIGVYVGGGASGTIIGGPRDDDDGDGSNVIAGSVGATRSAGIIIDANAGRDNRIFGNTVGLNASLSDKIPNKVGILVLAPVTTVGDETISNPEFYQTNLVVAGNTELDIGVANTSNVTVVNALVGITPAGTVFDSPVGIAFSRVASSRINNSVVSGHSNGVGVAIADQSFDNTIDFNCIGCGTGAQSFSTRNSIGLAITASSNNRIFRNSVVDNTTFGIAIGSGQGSPLVLRSGNFALVDGPATNNQVYSNKVGNTGGEVARPNSLGGIALIENANDNVIGGYSNDKANIISGNTNVLSNEGYGVFIGLAPGSTSTNYPTGNIVIRNRIGVREFDDNALPNNFGIYINKAQNNFIGTANGLNGNIIGNNAIDGIYVNGSQTTGNTIAGNSIFSNGRNGMLLESAGSAFAGNFGAVLPTVIIGNKIGIRTIAGINYPYSNSGDGIRATNTSNLIIGGENPTDGNIIGANNGNGIDVSGSSAGIEIRRNFIGTDPTAAVTLGNLQNGIKLDGTTFTEIDRNTIAGNTGDGVVIENVTAPETISGSENQVQPPPFPGVRAVGNYTVVETAPATFRAVPNGGSGFRILNSSAVLIGKPTDPVKNIIAGNLGHGIVIDALSRRVTISNALIGRVFGLGAATTGANLVDDFGNGENGILITGGASENLVGGQETNAGNVISGNGGAGVRIDQTAGNSNLVDPNAISGNVGLGIDINSSGPTFNDPGDADEGANRGQNFPDIVGTTIDSNGDLIVNYRVDSDPANSNYGTNGLYVRFFIADSSGEGRAFLGFNYYTIADHAATLAGTKTVNLGNAAALGFVTGNRVTSSASDFIGNTSEFTPVFAPTAAGVSVSGRVASSNGQPLSNVIVTLTAADGTTVVKRTNSFGRYGFEEIPAGGIYTVTVTNRKFQFVPPTRILNLSEDVADADFTAFPE